MVVMKLKLKHENLSFFNLQMSFVFWICWTPKISLNLLEAKGQSHPMFHHHASSKWPWIKIGAQSGLLHEAFTRPLFHSRCAKVGWKWTRQLPENSRMLSSWKFPTSFIWHLPSSASNARLWRSSAHLGPRAWRPRRSRRSIFQSRSSRPTTFTACRRSEILSQESSP